MDFEKELDVAFREIFSQIGTGSARLGDLYKAILAAHNKAIREAILGFIARMEKEDAKILREDNCGHEVVIDKVKAELEQDR
jgi:hypothetical protein